MGDPLVSRAENRQKEAGMSPTAAPINQKFCILVTFVDYLHNKFQVPTSYRSTFSRCLFYRQTHRHTRTLDLDSRDLNTCFGPEKTDHRKFRSNTLLSFLYGTRKLKKKNQNYLANTYFEKFCPTVQHASNLRRYKPTLLSRILSPIPRGPQTITSDCIRT